MYVRGNILAIALGEDRLGCFFMDNLLDLYKKV